MMIAGDRRSAEFAEAKQSRAESVVSMRLGLSVCPSNWVYVSVGV